MIVINVELWPRGDPLKRRSLGVAHIENDGTGDENTGNYKVTLFTWGEMGRVWKQGKVTGFNRLLLGGWDLLYRGLSALVGDRNPQPVKCDDCEGLALRPRDKVQCEACYQKSKDRDHL